MKIIIELSKMEIEDAVELTEEIKRLVEEYRSAEMEER